MSTMLLAAILIACDCPTDPSGFAGGLGTVEDPYLICLPAQLESVREDLDAHYRLSADIDLSGVPWTPIADGTFGDDGLLFNGTFDGAGYTVSNMVAGGPSAEVIGLFGRIGLTGIVRDLRVENADVTSNLCGGALTAENRGLIERCSVSGTVSGGTYVGGFIGDNQAVIVDCYSEATVSANSFVGGFAGTTFVNDSGIPEMHRCHAVGAVTGGGDTGGLVGRSLGPAIAVDCFWNVDTTGQAESWSGTGVDSAEMEDQSTFDPPWDFKAVWSLAGGEFPLHVLVGASCCVGDLDADGDVGLGDLLTVLASWGPCSGCAADLDGDGEVGLTELLTVLAAWGRCA